MLVLRGYLPAYNAKIRTIRTIHTIHTVYNTYNTIHCHTLPYITIHYHTLPYITIQYHAIPYTIYHTIPYNTTQYHTIPHTIIHHIKRTLNTIQHHKTLYTMSMHSVMSSLCLGVQSAFVSACCLHLRLRLPIYARARADRKTVHTKGTNWVKHNARPLQQR